MGQSTPVSAQREIPLMAEMPRPQKVRAELLNCCDSLLDAIHLCVQIGRLPHYAIAQRLGIDKGHWARMMQGQAHFPTNKIEQLMQVCGNLAPMQFLAMHMGYELFTDPKAQRREELMRELASLEADGRSTFDNEGQRLAA